MNKESKYWKHHAELVKYFKCAGVDKSAPRRLTGAGQAVWLYDLVKETSNDAWICEIGSLYGYLTTVLALACEGSNKRVVSVDHMVGDYCMNMEDRPKCIYIEFMDALREFGVSSKVVPFPMKSYGDLNLFKYKDSLTLPIEIIRNEYLQAHEMLTIMNIDFELIYIDGNHSYENVSIELNLYTKLLKLGGIIAGDDYPSSQTVKAAVQEFFQGNKAYEAIDVPGNQFGYRRIK